MMKLKTNKICTKDKEHKLKTKEKELIELKYQQQKESNCTFKEGGKRKLHQQKATPSLATQHVLHQ